MTADIRDEDRFDIRDDLAVEHIDGESVVFDLDRDVYFSLNEVARQVWKGLQRGETVGTIVETIAETYDIDPSRARSDTRAFLEEALQEELITRSSGDEPD